jgi:hypothetical protein
MSKLRGKLREIGMTYRQYLQSDHWKAFRKKYYQKYGYKCRICGSTENVNLHHKTYNRLGKEWLMDVISLCETHHHEFHAFCGNSYIWQNTKNFIKTKKVECSGVSQKQIDKAHRRLERRLESQQAFREKRKMKSEAKRQRRLARRMAEAST